MSSAGTSRPCRLEAKFIVDAPPTPRAAFANLTCTLPNSNNIRWQATPMSMQFEENKLVKEEDDRKNVEEAENRKDGDGAATERKAEIERVVESVVLPHNMKGKNTPCSDKENETPTNRPTMRLEGIEKHQRGLEARVQNASNSATNNAGLCTTEAQHQASKQLPKVSPRMARQEENLFRRTICAAILKAEEELVKEVLGEQGGEDDDDD